MLDLPPNVPPQYAPIVVAEAAQAKYQTMERTIGVCHLASSRPEERLSAVNGMSPPLAVYGYLVDVEGLKLDEAVLQAAKENRGQRQFFANTPRNIEQRKQQGRTG